MASDLFNQNSGSSQAIATYSANWTICDGSINIPTGNLSKYLAASGGENTAYWNAESLSADQYSQVIFGQSAANGYYGGPACRIQSGAVTYYRIDAVLSEYYVTKYLAGSGSTLAGPVSISGAAVGEKLRLEVTTVGGNAVLKILKNTIAAPTVFTQVGGDITDSSSPILTAGFAGCGGYDPHSTSYGIGSWESGSLGGGGGTDQPARRRFGGILHTPFKTPPGVRVF